MNITHTVCDREGCKKTNALKNRLFKNRISDGAGDRDDWFYCFDLCPECQQALIYHIFEHTRRKAFTDEDAKKFLDNLHINLRVE